MFNADTCRYDRSESRVAWYLRIMLDCVQEHTSRVWIMFFVGWLRKDVLQTFQRTREITRLALAFDVAVSRMRTPDDARQAAELALDIGRKMQERIIARQHELKGSMH